VQTEIFPEDTQWAIAAEVPAAVLTAARRRLSKPLRRKGSRVVTGDGGVSALLVFGGSLEEGYDLAITISQKNLTPAYLLDFNDEAYSIRQFEGTSEGTRVRWKKGHPAKLLRSHGITPPGYEPPPESPVRVVGLVEHVTLAEACEAMPEAKESFTAGSRGLLVKEATGTLTLALSRVFKRRSFTVFHDPEDMRFWCVIWKSDSKPEECFAIGRSTGSYQPIESVLGEMTADGILRALGIPRRMLFPDGAPAPRVRRPLRARREP
jgi:hypothetical protein